MTSRRQGSLTAAALALATAVTAQSPPDETRSAWQFRRTVTMPPSPDGGLVAVPLPAEVQARSQRDLRDLRLVDAAGRDVPYLAHEDVARRVERRWSGRLADAARERRDSSAWVVDFGQMIRFDRLELDIPGADFATRVAVELSADGIQWADAGHDLWVFDQAWQGARVHDTVLALPVTEARYARLQIDDGTSRRTVLQGVTAMRSDDLPGTSWTADASLELIGTEAGRARYRVPVPNGYPVRRLALDADDPAFVRPVTVFEQDRNGERKAAEALLYRLRLPEPGRALERREIAVSRSADGALVLDVNNADNPPLTNPRVRLSGPRTMLLTAAVGPALTLYYGNAVTRAPVYELEPFRLALATVPEYPEARVGDEVTNPVFRQPAPLAFVAARGATLVSGDWRFSRPFTISGAEDLYTLTMTPTEVARLRPDLGDLRVVDESDRQVPYVLEVDAAAASIPVTVSPTSARPGRRQTSALRLTLTHAARDASAVRLSGLRLHVAEPFFQRSAVVLQPNDDTATGGVVVASTTLASARREDVTGPVWVQIPLHDVTTTEVVIEITDGDNAPLTLLQAQAVAPVPRLTFKAAPGPYRLLMGNSDVRAPSYELGLLRREVLTYAAVPIEPGAEVAGTNPEFEPGVADYLRDAPPRVVLWTALAMAVVVLLALLRRILTSAT